MVGDPEQLGVARREMFLECALVWQQTIEPLVEPRVVHEVGGHAEDVLQRGAPIPGLGDLQCT